MKIKVLGRNIKDSFKAEVEAAARFYAQELMSTRMSNSITLRIEIRKSVKKMGGFISAKNNGSKAQKEMTIKLNANINASAIINVLAHEMVHAKQIAYKELQHRKWKSDNKTHTRWMGQEMGVHDSIPYRQRPWEVEAFGMQNELHNKYKASKYEITTGRIDSLVA